MLTPKKRALATLVLGIISVLFAVVPIIGWIPPVMGIIVGIFTLLHIPKNDKKNRLFTIIGIILCVVGVLFAMLSFSVFALIAIIQ